MSKLKSLALLFFIPLLSLQLNAQKTFYGTLEYAYQIDGPEAEMMAMFMPQKMIIKYGKSGMSTHMEGGMMAGMMGRIVVNAKTGERFAIKDSEKTVYMMEEEDLEKSQEAIKDQQNKPELLDGTETILGYTCKKYKMVTKSPEGDMEQFIWATEELKAPEMDMPQTGQMNSLDFGIEGLPLKVEIALPGTTSKMIMLATKVDDAAPDSSEFDRPKDYEVKPFSELAPMGGGF